jgi:hypothetical protein
LTDRRVLVIVVVWARRGWFPVPMWERMLPHLMRLPRGRLRSADALTDEFALASDGRVSVYWVPFERLNATARVAIVGLTPGHAQMEIAFSAARDALARSCG